MAGTPDAAKAERAAVAAFFGKFQSMVQDAAIVATAAVADRVGLFKLLAKESDARAGRYLTLARICELGQLHPRYVKEICGALACAGLVAYSPEEDGYALEPAQARVLADEKFALFSAGWLDFIPTLYQAVPGVAQAAATPHATTGVPFSAMSAWGASRAIQRMNDPGIRNSLVKSWLPKALPEVVERLRSGIRVADLGCGAGAAAETIARAFPASSVVGLDLDARSVELARASCASLANLSFECRDIAELEPDNLDLIVNHDCIHDLVDPLSTLRAVCRALKPGGVFFSIEPKALGDTLRENYGACHANPDMRRGVAAQYSISTLHCMTASCAHGGAGLGCATFGPKTYEQLARQAGFTSFRVVGGNPAETFYALSREGQGTAARSAL